MRFSRRETLVAAAATALLPFGARAQSAYPDKPIRLVVPFAPGGTTDIVARIIGQKLQERYGQGVVVDNRPGAGATLAAQQVALAPPDGYTLIVSNSASHGISPSLFKNVKYDSMTDFTHIAMGATTSTALVINPKFEGQTLADIVRIAKAKQGGVDFALAGHGTSTHLAGMRWAQMAGITLNPVPYRGAGPALQAVINGECPMLFDGLPSNIGFLRAGTLKAVAVSDATRNRFLPDIPTFRELGYDLISYSWFGISGPKGVPRPIVDQLNAEIRKILQSPDIKQRYLDLTADAPDMTPEQYSDFIRAELQSWGEIVRTTGITAE